jgi:hypothetical protein
MPIDEDEHPLLSSIDMHRVSIHQTSTSVSHQLRLTKSRKSIVKLSSNMNTSSSHEENRDTSSPCACTSRIEYPIVSPCEKVDDPLDNMSDEERAALWEALERLEEGIAKLERGEEESRRWIKKYLECHGEHEKRFKRIMDHGSNCSTCARYITYL